LDPYNLNDLVTLSVYLKEKGDIAQALFTARSALKLSPRSEELKQFVKSLEKK
jgi:hypothetical protein